MSEKQVDINDSISAIKSEMDNANKNERNASVFPGDLKNLFEYTAALRAVNESYAVLDKIRESKSLIQLLRLTLFPKENPPKGKLTCPKVGKEFTFQAGAKVSIHCEDGSDQGYILSLPVGPVSDFAIVHVPESNLHKGSSYWAPLKVLLCDPDVLMVEVHDGVGPQASGRKDDGSVEEEASSEGQGGVEAPAVQEASGSVG